MTKQEKLVEEITVDLADELLNQLEYLRRESDMLQFVLNNTGGWLTLNGVEYDSLRCDILNAMGDNPQLIHAYSPIVTYNSEY